MDKLKEYQIRASIAEAIEKCLESAEIDELLLGYNVAAIMADAALSVLMGVADAQEYLTENEMLTYE